MTALNLIGLNCKGMLKYGEWEALMREAKRERVNVLTLQELNVKPEMVSEFKRRALALDFDAFISCSDSAACRGGTGVLVRCGFAAASPEAVHWWGISLMYEVYIRKCLIRLVLGTISLIRRPPRYDPDMRDI